MNAVSDRLKYDLHEYKLEIQISEIKRLLVEGSDDKRFFSRLILELVDNTSHIGQQREELFIDTAQELEGGFEKVLGNREKIEFVCSSLDEECWKKFVAFVDREFRGFEFEEVIKDILPYHKVDKGLVRSRGHSVENYFFDSKVLRESFKDLVPIDWFDQVIEMFDRIVESVLKLACALSLTGNELEQLKLIKRSVHWKLIEIDNLNARISLDQWKDELINVHRQDSMVSISLIEKYNFWQKRLEDVDLKTLQWLCHGHIGMTVIWAVYTQCLCNAFPSHETRRLETVIAKMQGIGEELRFQSFTGSLTRKAIQKECEYPREVIELLGFSIS
jgi:hypothetical protein